MLRFLYQWQRIVFRASVRIKRGVRISEGQIIWTILYALLLLVPKWYSESTLSAMGISYHAQGNYFVANWYNPDSNPCWWKRQGVAPDVTLSHTTRKQVSVAGERTTLALKPMGRVHMKSKIGAISGSTKWTLVQQIFF